MQNDIILAPARICFCHTTTSARIPTQVGSESAFRLRFRNSDDILHVCQNYYLVFGLPLATIRTPSNDYAICLLILTN